MQFRIVVGWGSKDILPSTYYFESATKASRAFRQYSRGPTRILALERVNSLGTTRISPGRLYRLSRSEQTPIAKAKKGSGRLSD